jgi:glutamate-1-semialdehyde 2,1-aminomutase
VIAGIDEVERVSQALLTTAAQYLPGASLNMLTLPAADAFVIDHGEGAWVVDVRGKRYLDLVLGAGPLLLGHAHPAVVKAAQEQLRKGTTFYWLSEPSVRFAVEVVQAIPCAEQVRFVSTGNEATMFACRMARTATKREKILKFEGGFHGLHDYAAVGNWRTPSEQAYPHPLPDVGGIPRGAVESVLVAPFNDLDATRRIVAEHARDLAAIIVEPMQRAISPKPGFLAGLRDLTRTYDALLVFDEVVTGFRLAYGGAQEYYGVLPDLAVHGKAMTAGFSLAAVTGRKDVMATADPSRRGGLDYAGLSGTLSGNALACAAGLTVLAELRRPDVYTRLHALGKRFRDGIAERGAALGIPLQAIGDGPMGQVFFVDPGVELSSHAALRAADAMKSARFQLELLRRGLMVTPGKFYLSLAHTEADVSFALDAVDDALRALRQAESTR